MWDKNAVYNIILPLDPILSDRIHTVIQYTLVELRFFARIVSPPLPPPPS
jgi:hypothetical protein